MAGSPKIGTCEQCSEPFPLTQPRKRFCTERCRRMAECRRYRNRHTEAADCPHCGSAFERTTTSTRGRVYCTVTCQAAARSDEYRGRADIQAGIARARKAVYA